MKLPYRQKWWLRIGHCKILAFIWTCPLRIYYVSIWPSTSRPFDGKVWSEGQRQRSRLATARNCCNSGPIWRRLVCRDQITEWNPISYQEATRKFANDHRYHFTTLPDQRWVFVSLLQPRSTGTEHRPRKISSVIVMHLVNELPIMSMIHFTCVHLNRFRWPPFITRVSSEKRARKPPSMPSVCCEHCNTLIGTLLILYNLVGEYPHPHLKIYE